MADQKKPAKPKWVLPEGRVINHSLFEMDAYTDPKGRKADPSYKIEMAFDPAQLREEKLFNDNGEMVTFNDLLAFTAMDEWGDKAEADFDNGTIISPLLDGNKLAADREAKGKIGDAYKGKLVLRASTVFNAEGQKNGAGGVYVANPQGAVLDFTERKLVYNGCYGLVAVTLSAYSIDGDRGIKAYLAAFQVTRDGEPLRQSSVAGLFKPVGRTEGAPAATGGRRSRKG